MTNRWRDLGKRVARPALPAALLAAGVRPRATAAQRAGAGAALVALWAEVYRRYRRSGLVDTAREWEQLRGTDWEAFSRHYNERVPTIEEEFDLWGDYHRHRHEMRYDLVAGAARRHLPAGGAVLDVGCGSVLVADRLADLPARYVGIDFGGHHVAYASKKLAVPEALWGAVGRGDAEHLPFRDDAFDVVVMSEVIEHLMRPELAVWEVSRVLKPGGVFVMTTNNASEVPLRSPLSHLGAWLEKALGATHPGLISYRPWVWPEPVDPEILPPGSPPVFVPHSHHIYGETRRLFAAAGLDTFEWSTFEFPPPQSTAARWLDQRGETGQRAADAIEAVARRLPLVRRLGCHLLMLARRTGEPVSPAPPPGVWPGPLSP